MKYYIYILHSDSANRYYIGYSANPFKRLSQHLENDACKFTGKWKDWRLEANFYVSEIKGEAMKVEKFIKNQKSRILIERLIDGSYIPYGKLAQLLRVPHLRD